MKLRNNDYLPFAALLLMGLATMAHFQFSSVPQTIVDASAPDTEFSGERAHEVLLQILPENTPHPTGSTANKAVKNRIISWLANQSIETEVIAGWGCYPERGRCAWAENIIARVPGTADKPYIALMAHYDSVDASPGAGDNMLSVAIILEIARMMTVQGNHQNPLLLIFTDAEEDGRAGAEALFTQHPMVEDIGLVFNMEGTGSQGESLLFRAINGNAGIVRSYSESAAYPRGTSLGEAMLKILPSDTDLSVVDRVGIQGAEFGYTGFGKHTYHTPMDNTNNVDLATIQNHGENLYALVSGLVNRDVTALSKQQDLAYDTFYGQFLVWPLWVNYILVALSLVLLMIASYPVASKKQLLGQFFVPLLILVTTVVIMVPTALGLHFLRGETPLRPQYPIPYLMLTLGLPFLAMVLHARWLNKKWQLSEFLTGITWFWFSVGALLTLIAPKAAYIFLLPALTTAVLIVVQQKFSLKNEFLLLMLIVLVPVSIGKGVLLVAWQHYWFSFMSIPFSVLLASYLLPFLQGRHTKAVVSSIALIYIVAALSTLLLPTYDAENPQRGNLQLVQNFDTHESWLRFGSVNPVPDTVSSVVKFDSVAAIYPWGEKEISKLSVVEQEIEAFAELSTSTTHTDGGRVVNVSISNAHSPVTTGLVIPSTSGLVSYVLDGVTYPISPAWWFDWQGNFVLEFRGVQEKPVDVQLNFEKAGQVEAHLFEIYPDLPVGYEDVISARNLNAVPTNDGDQRKIIRRVIL